MTTIQKTLSCFCVSLFHYLTKKWGQLHYYLFIDHRFCHYWTTGEKMIGFLISNCLILWYGFSNKAWSKSIQTILHWSVFHLFIYLFFSIYQIYLSPDLKTGVDTDMVVVVRLLDMLCIKPNNGPSILPVCRFLRLSLNVSEQASLSVWSPETTSTQPVPLPSNVESCSLERTFSAWRAKTSTSRFAMTKER